MAASSPLIVRPAIVTVLFEAMALSANVAVAEAVESVTASAPITPESAAAPLMRREVAAVVLSYSLLLAVMPVTVRAFAVMLARAVG